MATFCLLHGAWHDPSCWDRVRARLEALGHRVVATELPLHDPAATYEERVRPALEALDALDVDGAPVVVVAHSQSSAFGPLVAARRPVGLLVYLCPRMASFEPPAGAPPAFREGFPFPRTGPDGTSEWERDAAIAAMYPRLSSETAQALADRLRPMGMPRGDYPLREHPDVRTALVYTTDDEVFQPEFERFMAREALGVEPIELPGGHFPMAEDPDRLAALLDDLSAGRPFA